MDVHQARPEAGKGLGAGHLAEGARAVLDDDHLHELRRVVLRRDEAQSVAEEAGPPVRGDQHRDDRLARQRVGASEGRETVPASRRHVVTMYICIYTHIMCIMTISMNSIIIVSISIIIIISIIIDCL